MEERGLELLQGMLGTEAEFRCGQWEAIRTVVEDRNKLLVVQRTGWGKSLVYFLATKLLREQGAGPTLLISPPAGVNAEPDQDGRANRDSSLYHQQHQS